MNQEPEFVVPEVRTTSEVKFHHDSAPGTRFLAIDHNLFPDSPLYVVVRRVVDVPENQPEYIESHIHSVDSLYIFLGNEEGMKGLHGVVCYAGQERCVESPMTVFIPKGVPHSYKLTKGSGSYLSILLDGDYNGHTFGVVGK